MSALPLISALSWGREVVSLANHLEIIPLSHPPVATIRVPGSKSLTNRALVLAAQGGKGSRSEIRGALRSEDTEVMIQGLKALGLDVVADWSKSLIHVNCPGPRIIPAGHAAIFVENSGTTMRFLTALVSLGHGRYRIDGIPRMRERPIGDLLDALGQLGVQATSENNNGCPPVMVESSGLPGGRVRVRGSISSQFLSALLLIAPSAEQDVVIEVDGTLVSWPYVAMTIALMHQIGLKVECHGKTHFQIPGRQQCILGKIAIEPDASSASYFLAAAAITGGEITIRDLDASNSLQGDVRFADLLEQMGCKVNRADTGLKVCGARLRGIDADMNDISDCVMTMAAVACFANGPTTIRNVGHIRHKETDRLRALAKELTRLGAQVEETPDSLKITPGKLHGATAETYNDHRMAMSLALIGLRIPGVIITNPGCVAKTYPGFFDDLKQLQG